MAEGDHAEMSELEAQDKATREMQYQQQVAAYYRPNGNSDGHSVERPNSNGRDPVPSACDTLFEEEETGSIGSEHEVHYAKATPLMQVRNHKHSNTLDSFVGLYENKWGRD